MVDQTRDHPTPAPSDIVANAGPLLALVAGVVVLVVAAWMAGHAMISGASEANDARAAAQASAYRTARAAAIAPARSQAYVVAENAANRAAAQEAAAAATAPGKALGRREAVRELVLHK